MTIALDQGLRSEVLTAGRRRYEWREGGSTDPRAARLRARRDELPGLFYRVVEPGLRRRGAKLAVRGVGPRGGTARAHWAVWQAPGDRQPVWALFVPTRSAPPPAVLGRAAPSNDGHVLAAWGDGPVLAWASEHPALRSLVREALRAVPEFLAAGYVSGDPTWTLKVSAWGEP